MPPTARDRQHYALQTIFSFFLGLMVTAFIGVGVNTFYESPRTVVEDQYRDLNRQMEDIQGFGKAEDQLTSADKAKLKSLQEQMRKLDDEVQAKEKSWQINTSIIIIVFATAVMGVSLIRSEELKVISNGLLLGGLFTMIYGTGWIIASGDSKMRFFVITFALVVALGLGYMKFVRGKSSDDDDMTDMLAGGGMAVGAAGAMSSTDTPD